MRHDTALLALGALALTPALAAADVAIDDVVINPDNGHAYMLVEAPNMIMWEDARAAAEALSFMGVSGHLATLTSAAENDFVVTNLPQGATDMYWLGGFQDQIDRGDAGGFGDPSANWNWVTGEAWEYTNWADFEPNDGGGEFDERFLRFWRNDWGDPIPGPGTLLGVWNDDPADATAPGFVVEFAVPAPGGLAAIGSALAVLSRRRRR